MMMTTMQHVHNTTMGNNPAPAPSPTSHCSRGGSQVLAATADDEGMGNRDARGEGMMREWGTRTKGQRDDKGMGNKDVRGEGTRREWGTRTQGAKGQQGNREQGHKGQRDDQGMGNRDRTTMTMMRGMGTGTTMTMAMAMEMGMGMGDFFCFFQVNFVF